MDVLAFCIVYLALFGGLGAAIGNNQRRPLLGFVAGTLLGPIGWFAMALSDYRPKCPACMNRVNHGATICAHCGKVQSQSRPQRPVNESGEIKSGTQNMRALSWVFGCLAAVFLFNAIAVETSIVRLGLVVAGVAFLAIAIMSTGFAVLSKKLPPSVPPPPQSHQPLTPRDLLEREKSRAAQEFLTRM